MIFFQSSVCLFAMESNRNVQKLYKEDKGSSRRKQNKDYTLKKYIHSVRREQ